MPNDPLPGMARATAGLFLPASAAPKAGDLLLSLNTVEDQAALAAPAVR
jgi:hypothetical protein